ncbi:alanine racemase [Photobacterium damselae]
MTSIKQNIEQVISEIDAAAKKCGRTADSVQLLAVSKTKPIAAIEEAIQAGQFAFGENYVQEGVEKIEHFRAHPQADALSKSGLDFEQVAELANQVAQMPNLVLRGLMSIPEQADDYESQLAAFRSLAQALEQLKPLHPQLDTLSMGMSGDMDAAIAAGSTIVRIGTAIFGARNYN